jgi:hypothetical protein
LQLVAHVVAFRFALTQALLEIGDALILALPRFVALAVDLLAQALELLENSRARAGSATSPFRQGLSR